MSYFFVDASHSLTVGSLSDSWKWIDFIQTEELPSVSLHKLINSLIPNEDWTNVRGVFFCKGPGSYTGLRLLEGFEQYLRFENIKCYDFYSFELKKILNIKKPFLYSAFKGQYLICDEENKLVNLSELKDGVEYYGEKLGDNFNFKSIIDLIKENPSEIFSKVMKEDPKDIYYFRPLSEEFKK